MPPIFTNKQNREKPWPYGLELGLVMIIAAASVWYRLAALDMYPPNVDELGSYRVMQFIKATGIPWIFDGLLYWRSLVAHYLMTVPLFFTSEALLGMRLVTVLSGGGTLLVSWLIARQVCGRFAALCIIAFLVISSFESYLVISNRFYGVFQLFFLLSVYGAAQYFIQKDKRYFWVWLGATLVAFGCHELSLSLFAVIAVAIFCSDSWRHALSTRNMIALATLFLAALVLIYFKPDNAFINVAAVPLKIGAMTDKVFFLKLFEQHLPGFIAGFVLCLAWVVRKGGSAILYYMLVLSVSLLLVSLTSPMENSRYVGHLFPLAAILGWGSFWLWLRQCWDGKRVGSSIGKALLFLGLLVGGTLCWSELFPEFERKSVWGHKQKYNDNRAVHAVVSENVTVDDVVVSMEPLSTEFYLGRPVDYLLRQRYNEEMRTLETFPQDEARYLGYDVIDSVEKLLAVGQQDKTVWIITNSRGTTIDEAMKYMLRRNYRLVYSSFGGSALVNRR